MNKKVIRFQGLSFREELEKERMDFVNQPIYLSLVPWEFCNWDCRYCHQDRRVKEGGELTLEEMKIIISEAAELGIRSVLFLGGEVLLKKIWGISRKVIEAIHGAGMITVIYTNGSQITKEMAEFLADQNVSIALKCDTLIPRKYDYLVGKKGAYKQFRQALDIIQQTSIGKVVCKSDNQRMVRILLSTVGCGLNVDEYVSIARFATEQNARWMMESLNCHGDAVPNIQELAVDALKHAQSMKLALGLNPAQFFDGGASTNGCRLFSGITIRKKGEIAICPQDYNFLGNIREVGLRDAWGLIQNKIFSAQLRKKWINGCPLKTKRKEVIEMTEELKKIILQLGINSELRKKFFAGKKKNILPRHNLTDEERKCLREISEDQLPGLVSKVVQSPELSGIGDIRI